MASLCEKRGFPLEDVIIYLHGKEKVCSLPWLTWNSGSCPQYIAVLQGAIWEMHFLFEHPLNISLLLFISERPWKLFWNFLLTPVKCVALTLILWFPLHQPLSLDQDCSVLRDQQVTLELRVKFAWVNFPSMFFYFFFLILLIIHTHSPWKSDTNTGSLQ